MASTSSGSRHLRRTLRRPRSPRPPVEAGGL